MQERRSLASTPYQFAARLQSALDVTQVEQVFLSDAPALVRARGYGLYRLDPDSGFPVGVVADVDSEFLDEYERIGRDDDPVLRFVRCHQAPADDSRAASEREWTRSGAYEALARAGFHRSLESPVTVAGLPCGTINFARSREDPPFDERDLRCVRRLGEQLGLALERAVRYEATGARLSSLESALDEMALPVVLTDLDGATLFTNRSARSGGDSSLARRAAPLIAEAADAFRRDTRRVNVAAIEDGQARLVVKSMRLCGHGNDTAMSVIYVCPESQSRTLPAWDVLSRREQEIAELVSEGLTTRQIAERAFVSENTVKQHLKRIFAKVDVHNRAELLQRIWTSRTDPTATATGPDQRVDPPSELMTAPVTTRAARRDAR